MVIKVSNQKEWKKVQLYDGKGSVLGRAAVGFGNPRVEGSRVMSSLRLECLRIHRLVCILKTTQKSYMSLYLKNVFMILKENHRRLLPEISFVHQQD